MYRWQSVNRRTWSYEEEAVRSVYYVFKMDALPDLSSPRFEYLGEKVQDRKNELIKKQLQMLRRIHDLNGDWGVSFRLLRKETGLLLYLIFRCSVQGKYRESYEEMAESLHNMIPSEYTFSFCVPEELPYIFSTQSFSFGAEIIKKEEILEGNIQSYYTCDMLQGISGDYQVIASALMQYPENSAIDITLVATDFLADEKIWTNNLYQQLKEVQQGERLKNDEGKTLKQFDPIPFFQSHTDNAKKMLEKYENGRMFLCSIKVLSDKDVFQLCNTLISGTQRTLPQIIRCYRGDSNFERLLRSYQEVDIPVLIHSKLWTGIDMPFRAQRFNRLYESEEIANVFRLPLSVSSHFPGFHLDTGLSSQRDTRTGKSVIRIGKYLDEESASQNEAEFPVQQLAKHGLIVGVPGSGKTTAMFHILHQLWEKNKEDRIPFIVMEPAKTEFRALKTIPLFEKDMLVFTLGDDRTSPFRFNPFEVLPGIPLERHISKLNACFVGAFDLFDPLPVLLDEAIRRCYREKGWYEDSIGGETGVEVPTLTDLCRNAEYVIDHSGFDTKLVSDFKASLLQRLNSLRRGSKGRMLDTRCSITAEELMSRPVVLELDALNADEKALMMMFILSFVFEYCKSKRKSGMPLKHLLVVEEAHNLIGAANSSDGRANPKEHTIQLFINMLAEMRALGEGILIADQLPTAIAPQAVKQTNVKILMRVTAKDDREEMGNTMDLSEAEMKNVVHFKPGHAYFFHEAMDKVRMIQMVNYKEYQQVEEPPSDEELYALMCHYKEEHPEIYLPFEECRLSCKACRSRVRSQAQQFAVDFFEEDEEGTYRDLKKADVLNSERFGDRKIMLPLCKCCVIGIKQRAQHIAQRYGKVDRCFSYCAFLHMKEYKKELFENCTDCSCSVEEREHIRTLLSRIGGE